ncbi:hypothetical protein FQA39_LY03629 [Lamprigera yunnana]|nr:hypothetical protein FQA39_LY03629 [Lamprigera yunnana]
MSTSAPFIKHEDNGVQTFVFNPKEEMPQEKEIRTKLIQLFTASVGSLICIPFGIMLGWPSPTYPKLLPLLSPIPITIDQSAMIAGFLMIGNVLSTPLSTWSFFGTKYGIIFGLIGTLIGWIIMWYATDIYFLLSSRMIIGLSFGYGVGQLKIYIKDLCTADVSQFLLHLINFHVLFGVILAYILGCFLSFTNFSMAVIVLNIIILVFSLFLPHSAKEYLQFGKIKEARTLIKCLTPNVSVEEEIQRIQLEEIKKEEDLSLFQVLRDRKLRKHFFLLNLLTFLQQSTGAPTSIVYAEIIFTYSHLPHPKIYSIVYAILFFISTFIGTFYCSRLNRKVCLMLSSIAASVALALNVAVFYLDFNKLYWSYSSLMSMSIFIFVHNLGLAVVPAMLLSEYFPVQARNVTSKVQIIIFSAMAVIVTKVFQVLYSVYSLYVPFCMFLGISVVTVFYILIFIPYKVPVLNDEKGEKETIAL